MKSLCNGVLASVVLGTLLLQISPADAQEKTVYKFCSLANCYDGEKPGAGLINVNGTLYGTTQIGGSQYYGTAFAFDPATGTETVLHSFCSQQNCTDGKTPYASLVEANGTLYGTTYWGGANGRGTMFSLDPNTGAETVLYSFCSNRNCKDGANPRAGLIDMHGKLYGTTGAGYGVVFSIDPATGREKVIYSFCSQKNCKDGAFPRAGLVDMNGTLFGTTYQGGNYAKGTLFSLDPKSGVETALHSFGSGSDGQNPMADLIGANGMLYGTTIAGGADGEGTVFSLDPESGAEAVLYSFCSVTGCPDGSYPAAGLTEVRGVLYGTTSKGGAHSGGTVFSLDPNTGAETVLYSFCSNTNCRDGTKPVAGLLKLKGRLYGTTLSGGRGVPEEGVIFWVKR